MTGSAGVVLPACAHIPRWGTLQLPAMCHSLLGDAFTFFHTVPASYKPTKTFISGGGFQLPTAVLGDSLVGDNGCSGL